MSTNSTNVFSIVSPPQAGDHPSIPPPAGDDDPLLTDREVAQRLRVVPTTVRNWAKGGLIDVIILPYKNRRNAYLIRTSTLDGLITPPSMTQAPQQ